ncbi:MAG: proline--tRNA ligase, partial [Tissierellia bacterium]|nr:proline--tRNA ligase [Tissierellia bacterium]
LLDNRNERAGVKFNDRELIGIPIQITVGKKADEGIVEFSLRKDGERIEVKTEDIDELIKKAFDDEGFSL